MRPLTRRVQLLTALAGVAVTAAGVLVVGQGYHTSQVRMHSGAIWLASARTGEATMVNGATAEVTTKVSVAEPGSALSVVQHGSSAFVLNRTNGELRRIDSATENVSPPVAILPAGDLMSAPGVLYVVDVHSGIVVSVDPDTLESRDDEPRQLAERITPGSVVVDGRGRLWAIDDVTGDLVWLADGERRSRSAANGRLAITQNRPVLVDPERGTADLLYPESGAVARSVRLDLSADDTMVVSGSADRSRLLIANGTRGELIACAFDTGSCAEPVTVASSGSELGAPVEVNDHAVVPDYSTGQATIIDLANSQVVARRQLFEQPTRFELVARDGIVFFNDPNSNVAGVLDLAGEVRTVTKYTEGPAAGDPTPDHRAQPDQVKKVDHKQKPGLGIAGRTVPTVQPTPTNPAPTPVPRASIVVKPGNRGVVGDEFELTMVAQSGAATTRWQFGDGTEAVGATVRHSWQQPGEFTVRAATTVDTVAQAETTVTVDPAGTPPSITALHVRRPKPVVGESVHFSADSAGKPEHWSWTVTKPGSLTPEVTAQTPEFAHRFATPGTYTIVLTVSSGRQTAQSSRQFTVVRGAVKGWGFNGDGQVSIPSSAASGVIAIAAGGRHSLALKSNGAVIAWGSNEYGQTTVPPEATSGVIAIDAGWQHSLALKADGSVVAWGRPDHGRTDVPLAAQRDVVAIAAGGQHSLALTKNGAVIAWGHNGFGQTAVPPRALSGVTAIAAGWTHSMAVKDGLVFVWTIDCISMAMPDALAVAAGKGSCLLLRQDGQVIGWDSDLGDSVPPAAQRDVIAVDAGEFHALALKKDGTAVGWGEGDDGEQVVPPQYSSGVLAVAAGDMFSLVLMDA